MMIDYILIDQIQKWSLYNDFDIIIKKIIIIILEFFWNVYEPFIYTNYKYVYHICINRNLLHN